jgi:hypothetical protein
MTRLPDICELQPCPYTDVDGRPTMYASGRPAWHLGGDDSIDTRGRYLNANGSSSWPGADGLLDDGWTGPSLPSGYPHPEAMEELKGKPYQEVLADYDRKARELRARRAAILGGGGVGSDDHHVGLFFYDPDLAKFGNAVSPIIPNISYETAQRAMNLPFADRYGPRLDAPTWADWWGEDPQTMSHHVGGAFDVVSEKTGLKKETLFAAGAIVALTAFLAHRSPEHALEIGVAGAAGVVLSLAIDVGAIRR